MNNYLLMSKLQSATSFNAIFGWSNEKKSKNKYIKKFFYLLFLVIFHHYYNKNGKIHNYFYEFKVKININKIYAT